MTKFFSRLLHRAWLDDGRDRHPRLSFWPQWRQRITILIPEDVVRVPDTARCRLIVEPNLFPTWAELSTALTSQPALANRLSIRRVAPDSLKFSSSADFVRLRNSFEVSSLLPPRLPLNVSSSPKVAHPSALPGQRVSRILPTVPLVGLIGRLGLGKGTSSSALLARIARRASVVRSWASSEPESALRMNRFP